MENTEYFPLIGIRKSDRPAQSESVHRVRCPLRQLFHGSRYTPFSTEGMQKNQYQNGMQLSDNTLLSRSSQI